MNIDETSSTCIKKYKVLVNQDFSFAPSVFDKDFSHATTILLFNVAGDSYEPFVILPNTNFDAFSSTREGGWMNKKNIYRFLCLAYILHK